MYLVLCWCDEFDVLGGGVLFGMIDFVLVKCDDGARFFVETFFVDGKSASTEWMIVV